MWEIATNISTIDLRMDVFYRTLDLKLSKISRKIT